MYRRIIGPACPLTCIFIWALSSHCKDNTNSGIFLTSCLPILLTWQRLRRYIAWKPRYRKHCGATYSLRAQDLTLVGGHWLKVTSKMMALFQYTFFTMNCPAPFKGGINTKYHQNLGLINSYIIFILLNVDNMPN